MDSETIDKLLGINGTVNGTATNSTATVGSNTATMANGIACKFTSEDVEGPTISWWILFLGVRQIITLSLARGLHYLIMAFTARKQFSGGFGPLVGLFVLQAKGWPFVLVRSRHKL